MSEDINQHDHRLAKLQRMRELGCDPYAIEEFKFDESAQQLLDGFEEGKQVKFAGRVVSRRDMGKASFCHLSDGDSRIQLYVRKDDVGESSWEVFGLVDLGDHMAVTGELFLTKTGEKSIHVRTLTPLSKSLHVLPLGKEREGESWGKLSDTERRYRHRHLDLITNPVARKSLVDRMKIMSAVRRFFDGRGYLEAETPMLQLEAGGAAARPFLTHFNAYEIDVKLRISLELYLKRIICGDIPRVYELGRVFRNEGVSNRHNPEFTLLEFYQAYANLEDMMDVVESLCATVTREVFGTTVVNYEDGVTIDFSKPWARVDLLGEIERLSGLTASDLSSIESAKKAIGEKAVINPANGKRVVATDEAHLGGLIEKLLEVFVEPTLIQPTFVIGYPLETSPLAKKDPARPGFTRRFEGYVRGRELCNAFSEINDPIDQRERFEQQLAERAAGDDEAHPMDEEFIYALECGMPPTGGCGIGMDRMAMLLTGLDHVREVLLFPFMKPVSSESPEEAN